ncbi:hypothetical protein FH969_06795 [Miniimonas arenae]|uniref:Uncharacterized protein n=1 Tax=Miniimonas arenae TaxID=676201 RepID=A0A5C5BCT9_9MICO|nr:hypothetical protein [Miniimonas arenae]TNU74908.1 hypothetical protein FH969_06795 [Miniimonas arenae]
MTTTPSDPPATSALPAATATAAPTAPAPAAASTATATTPPGPPTTPRAPDEAGAPLPRPVPPRSRARWHLGGVALALVGGTAAFLTFAVAAPDLVQAPARGGAPGWAWAALAAAMLLLSAHGGWAARSSAAAGAAGGIWAVSGLAGLLWPDLAARFAELLPGPSVEASVTSGADAGVDLALGAQTLLTTGGVLAVGVTLLGVAIAATIARRRGRHTERSEQVTEDAGDVTVPPRSRLGAHITSLVLGVVLAVLGVALTNGLELWGANRDVTDSSIWLAGLAFVVALLLPAALGATSSLGPGIAGLVWLASAVQTLLSHAVPSAVSALGSPLVAPLLDTLDTSLWWFADGLGTTAVVAAALLGGALGAHLARRDGRAVQRRERRIARGAARRA